MEMRKRMELGCKWKSRMDGMKGVAGDRRGKRELKMDIESIWELLLYRIENWYDIDSIWEL